MNDGTDEEGKLILALDVGGTKIAGSACDSHRGTCLS